MDKALHIGMVHYSCPPVVGGVEEVLGQQASILHRNGHSVSIISGMGEVYTEAFPVRLEGLLGSTHKGIVKAHERLNQGAVEPVRQFTEKIFRILEDWSQGLEIILAHNVLHMPFNLPLTLALRRLASDKDKPVIVSWAHDSPYLRPNVPNHMNSHPWSVLRRPHPNIHYVTISEARRRSFSQVLGEETPWEVIHNGIDPASLLYLDAKSIKLAEELNLFGRDLVVVQPSRITPRKNLELSVHIIRGIRQLGYDVLFVLTGAYDPHEKKAVSYYRRLRYWIEELEMQKNIAILAEYRFHDKTKLVPDRRFIRDLYLMADLLLMTSKDEGFGLPLLEAGLIKLPIACSEIQPFLEVGTDVCFFGLNDPPLSIAGRIIEYLARSNTHKMFRQVMKKYVMDLVYKQQLLPFLEKLTDQKHRHGR
jgi:glycosyltransferase involved in cell wall biosynthesis